MSETKPTIRLSLRAPKNLGDMLYELSRLSGCSRSDVIRMSIATFLNRNLPEEKDNIPTELKHSGGSHVQP